jgi:NAD(P)-dependent dehydrogenase (short-subunit alcohol dehydrogenase family)
MRQVKRTAIYDFRGDVIVVTGASSGIGKASLLAFAAAGARVVGLSRSGARNAADATADLHHIACDLADPAQIESAFAETERVFGPCTILVNNAGHIEPVPAIDMTIDSWDAHFAVNVRAPFLACRRALPGMIASGRGSIVNIASISGIPGPQKFPGFTAYCAAKAAVISFTEALAVELQGTAIRVNCVSPGSVDTPMLRRVAPSLQAGMTAEEVAETILFLASSASRPINGQNIHVYGA